MTKYYVNNTPQSNGDHDVHTEDCFSLAFTLSKTDLGHHATYDLALTKAQKTFKRANPCPRCIGV
ncbi:hypothetical protein [Zobellia alginiliquefaciens]|uniref:hypothetical protein n=1 Tax=Zobellia alginiliquefaciens TaxID=3032586 RepID=UPI0023E383C5|nr:hypothetical protein [Zobellia alginiliquefaciens]